MSCLKDGKLMLKNTEVFRQSVELCKNKELSDEDMAALNEYNAESPSVTLQLAKIISKHSKISGRSLLRGSNLHFHHTTKPSVWHFHCSDQSVF
jgi:hypothetical protein